MRVVKTFARYAFGAASLAAFAIALTIGAMSARAQVSPLAPVVVKVLNSATGKTAPKGNWMKAEVIHIDANSIIVREQANGMLIHTFTYSVELKNAMQKFLDNGGYQYGDKVKILYQPGQNVAMRVLGKPSKPL